MVDSIYNRCIDVSASGCRDHNFFCSSFDVFACQLFFCKKASTLKHNIDTKLTPRQLFRISLSKNFNLIAIDNECVISSFYRIWKLTMCRIIFCQMSIAVGITQIIDRKNLQFIGAATFIKCSHHISTNSSVSIDCYLYCHYSLLSFLAVNHCL